MNGRRVYHARGKVLGGSSRINGMIFQRGNPLDYERWAADPGMETWSFAHCLPYFKRMEDCTAAAPDDPWRGHGGPLALERGPATSPLFRAWFEAAEQAGYPLTADVNGYRQEGVARVRPEHPPRPADQRARAYLQPVRRPPEPRGPDADVRDPGSSSTGGRAIGVEIAAARRRHRDDPRRRGDPRAAARSTRRSCCSSRASARRRMLGGLGIHVVADLPGVGEHLQDHLEVYIQHGSQQPVSMQPAAIEKWRRPFIGAEWLFLRRGPGRDEPLRGRRVRPVATTTSPTRT